jgi:predicted ATPase
LWSLGYPDQALKRSLEALSLARELAHSFSLAYALVPAIGISLRCGKLQAAQKLAESVITLCTEEGFARLLASGTIMRGWELVERGQGEEGIAQMRQGLAAFRATGSELRMYYLALLAEAHRTVGQIEEGLSVLAEALAIVNKGGERDYEAELYRLKGKLTLQKKEVRDWGLGTREGANQKPGSKKQKSTIPNPQLPPPSTQAVVEQEAEECFLKAIDIAQKQQAKSLELRVTMSLVRLWQSQGKHREAHKLLADVYGWFTEGFDTKDLQEAKTLLEELRCCA